MNRRSRVVLLSVILGSVLACGVSPAADRSLTESRLRVVTVHKSPIGPMSGDLLWSPDGTLLVAEGRGVYLWDDPIDGAPRQICDTPVHALVWTADGKSLVMSRREPSRPSRTSELLVFDATSGTTRRIGEEEGYHFHKLIALTDSTFAAIDGPRSVPSFPTFYDTSGRKLSRYYAMDICLVWMADDGVWAKPTASAERVPIPLESRVWGAPLGALHREHLALTIKIDAATRCTVMDYGGKIQQVLPVGFDAKQWSADGRYLMGVDLQDDGHAFTAGEIGLLDTDTGKYTRLTDTPKVIEWGASWCEATNRLAYYDEVTGDVYIADLEDQR